MEAGKAIPITIEKNVADRTGKMVPMKVGVCMIGLGKQFKPGQASMNPAGKRSLAAAKEADKKLEGESVNQVRLLSHPGCAASCTPAPVQLCIYGRASAPQQPGKRSDSCGDRESSRPDNHHQEPVEVLIGFSNTPIDPQTCQMLGLPMGSMWGENASTVREEYMMEKQKAFEAYQSIGYPVGYPMSMPAQPLVMAQ